MSKIFSLDSSEIGNDLLPLRLPMALWRRLPRPVAVRADLSVLDAGACVLTCCQAAALA